MILIEKKGFFQNVGDELHRMILDIIHLLCQIDRTFAKSNVIDHPIVLSAIEILPKYPISVLNLLIDLVLTNELFPVQTNSKSIDLNTFIHLLFV